MVTWRGLREQRPSTNDPEILAEWFIKQTVYEIPYPVLRVAKSLSISVYETDKAFSASEFSVSGNFCHIWISPKSPSRRWHVAKQLCRILTDEYGDLRKDVVDCDLDFTGKFATALLIPRQCLGVNYRLLAWNSEAAAQIYQVPVDMFRRRVNQLRLI